MNINNSAIEHLKTFSELEPVYMLNYLKYKKNVKTSGKTGEEIYTEYMKAAMPFFQDIRAEVIFKGKPQATILGPEDEGLWDEILIVKYENKNEFFKLLHHKEYPFKLRESALEDSRLIFCK